MQRNTRVFLRYLFDCCKNFGCKFDYMDRIKKKHSAILKKLQNRIMLQLNLILSVSEMYNKEYDLPPFDNVVDFIENGFHNVKEKSKLSFLLAKLYGRIGDIETGRGYQKRGEEYLRKGE